MSAILFKNQTKFFNGVSVSGISKAFALWYEKFMDF